MVENAEAPKAEGEARGMRKAWAQSVCGSEGALPCCPHPASSCGMKSEGAMGTGQPLHLPAVLVPGTHKRTDPYRLGARVTQQTR